jgi:hypothetical protein
VTKKRLHRIRIQIDDLDPDIFRILDADYVSSYRRMRKQQPNKRFVLKIKRNVMWYINAMGIKL